MTELVSVVQQWALFIGVTLAVGCVAWRAVVAPGAARRIPSDRARVLGALDNKVARFGVATGAALVGAWILRMVAQVMGFRDPFVPLWDDVSFLLFETFWGTVWMAQGVIVGLLTAAFWVAKAAVPREHEAAMAPMSWPWRIATTLTVLLVATLALSGHAMGLDSGRALFVTVDGLHTAAAGTWIGSLGVILGVGRRVESVPANDLFAAQIRSFSPVALVSVGVLLSMGIVLAWTHLTQLSDLWTMTYGRVLSAKVALAMVVFAAGFLNWRKGVPSLDTQAAVRATERRAAWEVCIATGVLLLTAVLVHSVLP
jgi:putative copper export protein